MSCIIIISAMYFLLLFALIYIYCFMKSKKANRIRTENGYTTPSKAIVDSVGGYNKALPINEYLVYISKCSLESMYSIKGDFNG